MNSISTKTLVTLCVAGVVVLFGLGYGCTALGYRSDCVASEAGLSAQQEQVKNNAENEVSRDVVMLSLKRHDHLIQQRLKQAGSSERWCLNLLQSGALPPPDREWDQVVPNPSRVALPPEDLIVHPTPEELSHQVSSKYPSLDVAVEDAEWISIRLQNCLSNYNIVYLGELASMGTRQIRQMYQMGRKSFAEAERLLASHGLRMGMKISGWIPPGFRFLVNGKPATSRSWNISRQDVVRWAFGIKADPSMFEIRHQIPDLWGSHRPGHSLSTAMTGDSFVLMSSGILFEVVKNTA